MGESLQLPRDQCSQEVAVLCTVPGWPRTHPKAPVSPNVTIWTATCGSTTSTRGWKDVRSSKSLLAELLWTPTLPRWPTLRRTGPHAMSLITLQEDICHWTSSLFSEKTRNGQKNKGGFLQNMNEGEPVL